MEPERERLIQRARELTTSDLSRAELLRRIREVCKEHLIEAEVDVDKLLEHPDFFVRSQALDLVWWGLGKTDGIEATLEVLRSDPVLDVRGQAALALGEACPTEGDRRKELREEIIDTLENVAGDAELLITSIRASLKRLQSVDSQK